MTSGKPTDHLAIAACGIGRRVVLTAAGEIDLASAQELADAVDAALDGGALEVWIDLTHVDFMDTSGVHALLGARARAARLNRRLCVICPPGEPLRLLELTRLTGPLGVATTLSAAQRASV